MEWKDEDLDKGLRQLCGQHNEDKRNTNSIYGVTSIILNAVLV